jgi:hypothetical protein
MSARQRFVLGVRLLLVAVCVLVAGRIAWPRVDTRHVQQVTAPNACPSLAIRVGSADVQTPLEPAGRASARLTFVGGAPCGVSVVDSTSWTTRNRGPALALFGLGAAIGILGIGLARSHPGEPSEPASETRL